MRIIEFMNVKIPNIIADGERFIPIECVADLFMSDETAIKEYIASHSKDFVGYVIDYKGKIAIDWDGICKIDFTEIYSSAIAALMDIVKDELF